MCTLWLNMILCAQLDDLVLEDSIADLMSSDLTEPVDGGDLCVLNRKVDLNVAAIELLRPGSILRPADNLQGVAHVWRN